MKKILIGSIIILSLLSYFSVAYAAVDYTLLAPLPGTYKICETSLDGGVNGVKQCKTDFQTYLGSGMTTGKGIFTLAFGIATALAFVYITWGGIQYMTTDALEGKEKGRERIEDAIKGLLLVIGAYAILYTINPQILSLNLNIDQAGDTSALNIPKEGGSSTPGSGPAITPGTSGTGNGYTNPGTVTSGTTLVTDQQTTITNLLNSNVIVSNGANPCTAGTVAAPGCTSLVGLPQYTLDTVVAIKQQCCNLPSDTLTITGGDESHSWGSTVNTSAHGDGKPVLDIGDNAKLDSWLGISGTPTNGQWVDVNVKGQNVRFIYESAGGSSTGGHWHVEMPQK